MLEHKNFAHPMAVSSAANAACVTKLAYYVSITGSKYKKKK
jgi:hypothetical protein